MPALIALEVMLKKKRGKNLSFNFFLLSIKCDFNSPLLIKLIVILCQLIANLIYIFLSYIIIKFIVYLLFAYDGDAHSNDTYFIS